MSTEVSDNFMITMYRPVLSRIGRDKFLSIGGKFYAVTATEDSTDPEYSNITFKLLDETQSENAAGNIGVFDTLNDFWLLLHENGTKKGSRK